MKPAAASTGKKLDSDIASSTNTVTEKGLESDLSPALTIAAHDVLAALAIINGYSTALDSSFVALTRQYDSLLAATDSASDGLLDPKDTVELLRLEADCRFCLSRLCRSIGQLKERLRVDSSVVDSTQLGEIAQ